MTGKKSIIKTAIIIFIIAAGILSEAGSAFADAPQFRLDADSLNLEKGQSTNLVLSVINAQGAEIANIDGLENFDVVSSNTSTSTQLINGDATYQENYNYIIMPKKTGKFILYGNVQYGGKTWQTNKLEINVSQASSTPKGPAEEVFVKTLLSSSEVYYGQKIILTYELYSRYNVENFGFLDNVNISQFMCKEVPQDKLQSEFVYIDGNKYVKYQAKQMYLSPIKAGTYNIPAYKFQVNLSTGDFFNSTKPVYLQTDSKKLTVKPLPSKNKPADFSGLVGKLNIEAKYSRQEVNYGDSLTLQVTASGDCNLDSLKKIVKDDIPGFSVYATEKNTEESIENNQYKSKKEFEIILVPEQGGDITIDPIQISYFNPKTASYEKATIPGTTIKVKGNAPQGQSAAASGSGAQSGVQPGAQSGVNSEAPVTETIKIDQISYRPDNGGYFTVQLKKTHLLIGFIVLVILLAIGAAAFLLMVYSKKYDRNLVGIYKQIRNCKDENEVYNLFNSMIKYRFNLSLKASPREIIISRLTGHDLVAPVLEIIDYMEKEKAQSAKGSMYLKDKIKEIYKKIGKAAV